VKDRVSPANDGGTFDRKTQITKGDKLRPALKIGQCPQCGSVTTNGRDRKERLSGSLGSDGHGAVHKPTMRRRYAFGRQSGSTCAEEAHGPASPRSNSNQGSSNMQEVMNGSKFTLTVEIDMETYENSKGYCGLSGRPE
jgi:hypothetical protein